VALHGDATGAPDHRSGPLVIEPWIYRHAGFEAPPVLVPEHPPGASHAGHSHACPRRGLLRIVDRLRLRLRTALRRTIMIFDYSLAGLVSAALLFYLTYA